MIESAIERLATELLKLPVSEWNRLVELRLNNQQQPGFWQAEEDELTERLAEREIRCQAFFTSSMVQPHTRFRLTAEGTE